MAHLTRSDIPFHYALADAFTVCDAYHCSLLGPTDPNRYHMWTGWVGNDGKAGGPAVGNEESGYRWTTYPERLQKRGSELEGLSGCGAGPGCGGKVGAGGGSVHRQLWRQRALVLPSVSRSADGIAAAGEGGAAESGTQIARVDSLFEIFAADVKTNRLPQVSWVVAPEAYSEHPNWPANYGAWYVSQILDALTANPEVWSSTVFFLMFDENDGFFDHMVPPMPPATRAQGLSTVATTNEIFPGKKKYPSGPYGLGVRVPMIVISPWSKGGWVNSEVFDHTSLIRFVEQRFGVHEPNITPWRRAVAGDLTSAFDFKTPHAGGDAAAQHSGVSTSGPSSGIRITNLRRRRSSGCRCRKPGTRPARALPYALGVRARVDRTRRAVELHFRNTGKAAAVFHVRAGDGKRGAWSYTVGRLVS